MRVGAHAAVALGRQVGQLRHEAAALVEELLRTVALHPRLEEAEVVGVGAHLAQRHLVGAPRALDRQAVDEGGAGPALGAAQDDHRPARAAGRAILACRPLDPLDRPDHFVHDARHQPVGSHRLVDRHETGFVAVALEQGPQLRLGDARQDGRVGDLVAVEVEDREDRPVADGRQELVGVPARGERSRFGLAVADDAADDQVGVVEGRPVRVGQRVAEFAALVDGARRLRRDVTGDAAREGELAEQLAHALAVGADVRVDLAVGPLQVGVGHETGAAMTGPGDVDGVQVPVADDAVHVGVDEVEARRRAPVPQQARLDVLGQQRLAQQRVGEQVDLADREVVGGPPVRVEAAHLVGREGRVRRGWHGHRRGRG